MKKETIGRANKNTNQDGRGPSIPDKKHPKSLPAAEKTNNKLSPKVKRLMGIITLPKNFDHKKEIGEALIEKYNKTIN